MSKETAVCFHVDVYMYVLFIFFCFYLIFKASHTLLKTFLRKQKCMKTKIKNNPKFPKPEIITVDSTAYGRHATLVSGHTEHLKN